VEATKPPKLPVTAFVTAPDPTAGEVQSRVFPLPVHDPAAAVELDSAAEASAAAVELDVATVTSAAAVELDTAAVTSAAAEAEAEAKTEEAACCLLNNF
jgi:hypothetical protein